MSRQCYLVLDLFLLELQYLGWTENPMPKTLKTAISRQYQHRIWFWGVPLTYKRRMLQFRVIFTWLTQVNQV